MLTLNTLSKISGIFLISSILSSCGPSAQEREAAKKEILESSKQNEELLIKAENRLIELKNSLIEHKAQLEVERSRLEKIKEFQFLRTRSEKENQIRNQTIVILNLEETIEEIKTTIKYQDESIVEIQKTIQKLDSTLIRM